MKKFIPILAIVLLVVFYLTGFNAPEAVSIKDKDFNYNFTIKTLEGEKVAFESLKGKVVFINLWATWCGPCRTEMPGIHRLYEKTRSDDIAFVMLSIDKDGDQKKVSSYIKKNNFSFPVYMPSGSMSAQLNVPSIPTTFIISKEGKVAYQKIGSTNYDTEKYIKMLQELAVQ